MSKEKESTTIEKFQEELKSLLEKYPTCSLRVSHQIQVFEVPQQPQEVVENKE